MPASNAEVCPARLFRALLVSTCAGVLVCGLALPGLALDGDLPAGPGAAEQVLGGGTEIAAAPDDPFVSREIALSGFVEESFEDSLVRAGAPAGLSLKLKDALSSALDRRQLDSGDKFFVRYEQAFAADGREIGAGRIVSAEVATAARGRIAFYGFRPTRGAEQLWLASGESLAAPPMRLPLETVSVSSGFGVRADPFEQPQHGLGAPSRLGTVGATINTATARGIALGLAPAPGKTACPRRRHVPDAQRGRSGRANRHAGPGGGERNGRRCRAQRRLRKLDSHRARAEFGDGLRPPLGVCPGYQRRGKGPARPGHRLRRQHRPVDRRASPFRGHQQRPGDRSPGLSRKPSGPGCRAPISSASASLSGSPRPARC